MCYSDLLKERAVGPVVDMKAFSQCEQCPAQRMKRISFTPQFVGTGDRERFYFGAGALAVAPKSKEIADVLDRKAEIARIGDEPQAMDNGIRIIASAAVPA